jgi:hypothetical protein
MQEWGFAHEGVLILPPLLLLGGLGLCFCQFFGGFLCFGVAAKRLLVCCHSCACSKQIKRGCGWPASCQAVALCVCTGARGQCVQDAV